MSPWPPGSCRPGSRATSSSIRRATTTTGRWTPTRRSRTARGPWRVTPTVYRSAGSPSTVSMWACRGSTGSGGGVVERPIAEQLPGKNTVNFYEQAEELPTDTDGMHRWLYGLDPGEKASGKRPADVAAFKKAGALLTGNLLPTKTAAALYRAVSKIPGLIVLEGARDAAGRTGVAVAMDGVAAIGFGQGESRSELIFDEKTLDYLGESTVNLAAPKDRCDALAAGDLVGSVAILERTVVDRKGEQP
ncbi:CU044_5270 family protein [Streptomyces sp. GLT-R25]